MLVTGIHLIQDNWHSVLLLLLFFFKTVPDATSVTANFERDFRAFADKGRNALVAIKAINITTRRSVFMLRSQIDL